MSPNNPSEGRCKDRESLSKRALIRTGIFAGTVARVPAESEHAGENVDGRGRGRQQRRPFETGTVCDCPHHPNKGRKTQIMIPTSAVKTEGDINKVYVIKDGAAHEHLVQLGLLENDMIQVKTGLTEGDAVARVTLTNCSTACWSEHSSSKFKVQGSKLWHE